MIWSAPLMQNFKPPVVVLHTGLGPGDTFGHQDPKPKWYLRKLEEIGNKVLKKIKTSKLSAAELCLFGAELLESEPLFNAGRGAKLQADGKARLSASFMDGARQRCSGVLNIQSTIQPSKIAFLLNEKKDRLLAADGAEAFLFHSGEKIESPITKQRYEDYLKNREGQTGTVGVICLDSQLNTAAVTSTGGRGLETPGRVSDSGTVAGNFASPFGAASCTGVGEDIMDAGLAVSIVSRLEDQMSVQEAVSRAFLRNSEKKFGVIALDRKSNVIVHATTGTLGFVVVTSRGLRFGLDFEDWVKPCQPL